MIKKIKVPQLIMFLAPLFTGLLRGSSVFFMAILCAIGIILKINKNKRIVLPKGRNLVLLSIYIISFLFVEFWAVDKGINIFGFFRMSLILLFVILLLQYEDEKFLKEDILEKIPYAGIISLVVSGLLILFDNSEIIIDGRLNGTFLYANTYALFLLTGIYITFTKEKIKSIDYIIVILLGVGILLTNSRAIILLTLIVMLIFAILKIKKEPKTLCIIFIIVFVLFGIYFYTGLNERMLSIFDSSEFKMRLVYYEDAVEMIMDNPFGLGYNGYYYKQLDTQTAPYYTKTVHSFILQFFLDVGIIPALCILWLFLTLLISKKLSIRNKFLVILILLHSVIDINFEYLYYWLLIVLLLDFETINIKIKNIKIQNIMFSCIACVYLILFSSEVAFETKNYKVSYGIVPFHTDALIQDLYDARNKESQIELSNRVYELNKYITAVYQILSVNEQQSNNYKQALIYEKKRLNLNRLYIESYEKYFEFLENMFNYYNDKEDYKNLDETMDEILKIKDMVAEINKTANPAYVPTLQLSDEIEKVCEAIYELKNGGNQ